MLMMIMIIIVLTSVTPTSHNKHETLGIRTNTGRTAASKQQKGRQSSFSDTFILGFLV